MTMSILYFTGLCVCSSALGRDLSEQISQLMMEEEEISDGEFSLSHSLSDPLSLSLSLSVILSACQAGTRQSMLTSLPWLVTLWRPCGPGTPSSSEHKSN